VFAELRADATVLEASDGAQALRLAADNADLDLVVIDLGLPDRDGFTCSPNCASVMRCCRSWCCRRSTIATA
jgi:CheY-like chemotaxis protein